MAVESAADRAVFVAADEFAVSATYAPAVGGSTNIAGILDDPHLSLDFGERSPLSAARPTFLCRSADLPAGAAGGSAGDTLTIASVTYAVDDLQPDATGMTLVTLAKN